MEFKVGDPVRLHDPEDESQFLEGTLVPWEEVPEFMRREPGGPSFSTETGRNDGPRVAYDQDYLVVFGLSVTNVDPMDLDGHPYPVHQLDVSRGDLRKFDQ